METNSFAAYNAQYMPGTRLAERLLFTEEMHLSAFLRDSRDFLFGDLAVEDVAELMSEMDFGSVREYIRTMGVDVKKLVYAAKLMKSETGFSPRLLTRREKAEQGAMSEHERMEYAVNREHYGEVNFGEENSDTDWDAKEKLGETNLKHDPMWWWRENVTMKPWFSKGRMCSGIRLSFNKNLDRFIPLSDFKIYESWMLKTPTIKRFIELWRNEPDRLGWVRHRSGNNKNFLWAATMEISVKADPKTGRAYREPKTAHLWAYVSQSSMENKDAVKAVARLALSQRRKVKAWTPPAKEDWWKNVMDDRRLFLHDHRLGVYAEESIPELTYKDAEDIPEDQGLPLYSNSSDFPDWRRMSMPGISSSFWELRQRCLEQNGEL